MIASNVRFEIDGIEYTWHGGLGTIFSSNENLSVGDVRVINHTVFYVYMVTSKGWFRKPEIGWTVQNVDCDKVRKIQQDFFV